MNYVDPTGYESGSYCDRGYCNDNGDVIMADGGNNNSRPALGGGLGNNQDADVISDLITGIPSSQEMCESVLSGAPLLCNPNNIRSAASSFGSTTESFVSFPGPLDYPSMLFEVSNTRGWTRRAIPGVLGAAFDFTGQRMIDENMGFSPLEANVRALAVVGEGIIIDYVSLSASGLSAVGSIEAGPGVVVVMISVYIGSNITLSSGANTLNSEIFFPLIHELTN
jgi:hypothetical protein